MNNNKLKEIYEANPSDWVIYALTGANTWIKVSDTDHDDIQLIAKQHEHIADAVIANPEVEVEQWSEIKDIAWATCPDFFRDYDDRYFDYRLKETKPVNFNNGYIKASQEAYDLLVEQYTSMLGYDKNFGYMYIENNEITMCTLDYIKVCNEQEIKYKQLCINNGELSWDESTISKMETVHINSMEDLNELPIVGEEEMNASDDYKKGWKDRDKQSDLEVTPDNVDGFNSDGSYNHVEDERGWDDFEVNPAFQKSFKSEGETDAITDSRTDMCNNGDSDGDKVDMEITDDDGKVYSFEKPKFECELLKVTDKYLYGLIFPKDSEEQIQRWDLETGRSYFTSMLQDELIPIKPKEEIKFPALMINRYYSFTSVKNKEEYLLNLDHWRLATKDELDGLYYEGKNNEVN